MASLSWISSNPDYINQMIRNTQVTLSNNYNDLDNIPIIKITSTTNNPQKVWELKEGLYMINGIVQVDNSTSYEVSNLLISMSAKLENGKYILSAFIPYLRGLFEYILKTNSTEYEQHQKIVLMIKDETLTLDNETAYTPTKDYHPATKKYVDDKANEIVTELDRIGINKENLESLSKENRIRDIKLQALLSETSDRNITIEEDVRYFDMPLSIDNGIVTINEMVGDTLVNVCDQEESTAITKSYTIENENHIVLQGEYDGSCRPVVYGNTLVNHNADWDDNLQTGVETSAEGTEDVQVEGIKGQEVSVVVEGNTVLNHALGKTSAVVSSIESENEGNYVDLTVTSDMSSVVEIEGRTMYYNNDTDEFLDEFIEDSNLSLKSSYEYEVTEDGKYKVDVKVTDANDTEVDSKTFYLNSPLLEGDKIVTKNGKVYHYHKMGRVVLNGSESNIDSIQTDPTNYFTMGISDMLTPYPTIFCDTLKVWENKIGATNNHNLGVSTTGGNILRFRVIDGVMTISEFKKWLQANPTTVVYELASPYYELIDEYNNTILNIPKNVAHLTHTSAVPVNNTTFTNYKDELNVLEANTQYRVMFDCDKASIPFTVTLGGTSQEVTSIKGTHSLLITTPSDLVDKNLVIDGIGRCGIDNIRIFKGDVEYDYVKGLWSGYEERKLNVSYKDNYSFTLINSNQHFYDKPFDNNTPYKPNTIYTYLLYVHTFVCNRFVHFEFGNTYIDIDPTIWEDIYSCDINKECIKVFKLKTKKEFKDNYKENRCYIGKGNDYTNITNCDIQFALIILEGDWTDNPPTYEEVLANEGKYAVKVKLDTNATIFGKGGRL